MLHILLNRDALIYKKRSYGRITDLIQLYGVVRLMKSRCGLQVVDMISKQLLKHVFAILLINSFHFPMTASLRTFMEV